MGHIASRATPIYVGYVCLLIGFPLVLDSLWGLAAGPGFDPIHGPAGDRI